VKEARPCSRSSRDLQTQARPGASRRGRLEASSSRRKPISSGSRTWLPSGGLAGDARYLHLHARQRAGQSAARLRSIPKSRGQLRLTPRSPRRSTASSPRICLGRRLVGASSPTQLATIVAPRPDLCELHVNEQDVLRFAPKGRAPRITVAELRQLPIEAGLQTRRLSACRQARLCRATINQSTGTLAVRGLVPIPTVVTAARLFRPGPRSHRPAGRSRCWCPTPRSAATERRYLLVVNADNVVEQRKVLVAAGWRPARDRKRAEPVDRVVVAGLLR